MDIKKLAAEGRTEEIERQLLDLDSKFNFKCRKCGKCCKHQDTILFNTRDIFNIARKLQLTPAEVIEKYAETYIGSASKIPVVHMVPRKSVPSWRRGVAPSMTASLRFAHCFPWGG